MIICISIVFRRINHYRKRRAKHESVSNGYERPVVVGELDEALVERIYAVCPGTRIEGLPENEVAADTKVDNVWGPWRRMMRGWASDANTRFEGSTAGVLTALAQFLLAEKRVDFISAGTVL